MSLFNLGKKKEEVKEESCCCCGGESSDKESCDCVDASEGIRSIKVLGAGCKSCHEMYENTKKAAEAAGKVLKPADIENLFHKLGLGQQRI